ncbi:MAG: cobyrinate a,c-diamide synthase [Verrucomicrobiota bacterium]
MAQRPFTTKSPRIPGFCLAGTHSGVGKTTLTLGVLTALSRRFERVQPFKCGPDYIDPGHHLQACGTVSRNLDTWMMGEQAVKDSFQRAASCADAVVVEGVMGLFDGASPEGLVGSTAHVCMLLELPVVLVVDVRSMARSVAAVVHGFASFEPDLHVAGVIANNVRSDRHRDIVERALASAGLPPLLGALPRQAEWETEERHLGLIASSEAGRDDAWYQTLADGMEKHLDLNALPTIKRPAANIGCRHPPTPRANVRLAIARDAAFHFYYQDNLDALVEAGAELVDFSPLQDAELPDNIQGIYIGGGFPEMFAQELAANKSMHRAMRAFADADGWIYAECGGYMYLCRCLTDAQNRRWDMCGVLPQTTQMQSRLRRLGYVEVATRRAGIFGDAGTRLRGHEFHWSALAEDNSPHEPLYEGYYARKPDELLTFGIRHRNVCASYVHIHFASNPQACEQWIHNNNRLQ